MRLARPGSSVATFEKQPIPGRRAGEAASGVSADQPPFVFCSQVRSSSALSTRHFISMPLLIFQRQHGDAHPAGFHPGLVRRNIHGLFPALVSQPFLDMPMISTWMPAMTSLPRCEADALGSGVAHRRDPVFPRRTRSRLHAGRPVCSFRYRPNLEWQALQGHPNAPGHRPGEGAGPPGRSCD